MMEIEIIERAFMVARLAHANQMYDIYPYEYHLRETLKVAKGIALSEDIQVACVLHDALEDTSLSYNDIKKAFGKNVAEIVYSVTDELGRNRKERKEKTYPKIRGSVDAVLVKLCDRIANVKHSKGYNERLFNMYVNEHSNFKNNIVVDHLTNVNVEMLSLTLENLYVTD